MPRARSRRTDRPPDDGGVLSAVRDDTSHRDLDIEAHPLPAVAHALWCLWGLRVVVCATALVPGIVVGPVMGGGVLATVGVTIPPLLWVGLLLLPVILFARGSDDTGLLRLERDAHPRFFAVVDDVCARLSVAPPRFFFVLNEANSYNASVHRESSILLGLPALFAYDVAALRSTLGHELGHHLAGDADDAVQAAWFTLQGLGTLPVVVFPFAPLARRLARLAEPDTLRRSRIAEHAADFWGGVAAGPGTTAASLLRDRLAFHLWTAVTDDVAVLQEAGLRVSDLYRVLAVARGDADEAGFALSPSSLPTEPGSTHPAEATRIEATEARLDGLPTLDAADGQAMDLFEAAGPITRDLTDLFYDPHGRGDADWLTVVDDHALWVRYIEALRPQLAGGLAAVGRHDPTTPTSPLDWFHELRPLLESGVRFVVERDAPGLPGVLLPRESVAASRDVSNVVDVTERIVGLLLDLLVADGVLGGSTTFGTLRTVTVGDADFFRLVLAHRLARGECWDDVDDAIAARERRRGALLSWLSPPPTDLFRPPPPPRPAWERDTEESVVPAALALAPG